MIVIRYNLTKSRHLYLLLSPFLLMMIIIIFFFPLYFHYYSVQLESGWCDTFHAQFSTVKCQAGCKALEYFRNLNFINFAMQSDNLLIAFTETLFIKTIIITFSVGTGLAKDLSVKVHAHPSHSHTHHRSILANCGLITKNTIIDNYLKMR